MADPTRLFGPAGDFGGLTLRRLIATCFVRPEHRLVASSVLHIRADGFRVSGSGAPKLWSQAGGRNGCVAKRARDADADFRQGVGSRLR
jgi:hypothetical protein